MAADPEIPRCPKDRTIMMRVPIRWGILPDPEKKQQEGYGGAIYPGCLVPPNPPDWGWRCSECGYAIWEGKR